MNTDPTVIPNDGRFHPSGSVLPSRSLITGSSTTFSLTTVVMLGLLVTLMTGCATHYDRLSSVRNAYFRGDLHTASAQVDEHLKKRRKEKDAFWLDKAMLELASGRPRNAELILRDVRTRFDHLEEKDVGELGLSMLSDDNAQAYAGEDYERVLIRAMLALSNLMQDGGDAEAYALQMVDKQQQIIDAVMERHSPKEGGASQELAYKQIALGPYIRAMLAEESPLTLDEAARARVQVAKWEPTFRDADADIRRVQYDRPLAPGRGALYIFALVGRGPIKQETEEVPTQAALLIADRIVSAISKRGLPPTIAPVKVPQVVNFASIASAVAVKVDGQPMGQTATLVDVGTMAVQQQQARYTEVIARAVARRVVKKGIIYAVKEMTDTEKSTALGLAFDVAGVAWEASEHADTRCWGLLPDTIQVLRVELPVGTHQVALTPATRTAEIGSSAQTEVTISDGRNTYLMGILPSAQFVGELLTSSSSASGNE